VEPESAARPDVVFTSRAAVDVSAAFEWYELQREGLGKRFLGSVDHVVDALRRKVQEFVSRRDAPTGGFQLLLLAIVYLRPPLLWPCTARDAAGIVRRPGFRCERFPARRCAGCDDRLTRLEARQWLTSERTREALPRRRLKNSNRPDVALGEGSLRHTPLAVDKTTTPIAS